MFWLGFLFRAIRIYRKIFYDTDQPRKRNYARKFIILSLRSGRSACLSFFFQRRCHRSIQPAKNQIHQCEFLRYCKDQLPLYPCFLSSCISSFLHFRQNLCSPRPPKPPFFLITFYYIVIPFKNLAWQLLKSLSHFYSCVSHNILLGSVHINIQTDVCKTHFIKIKASMETSLNWFTKAIMIAVSLIVIGAFVQLYIKASKQQKTKP